ncbi:MAG: sugar phosphate isomerase/epimerase family protein [bacterium]
MSLPLSFAVSVEQTAFEAVGKAGPLEEHFGRLAEIGYDGIELAVRNPGRVDRDKVLSLKERTGLSVSALGTGQAYGDEGLSLTDPEEQVRKATRDRLRDHIDLAYCLGIQVVIVGLIRGNSTPGMGRKRCMELVSAALQELGPVAFEHGVWLVVEPINRYETDLVATLEEAGRLIEESGSQGLGLLPDTFHMNIEEADPLGALSKFGGKARHFHVADSNRWAPGHGHLDFAAHLNSLVEGGYGGWVSVECLPRPEDAAFSAFHALSKVPALGRHP